MHDMTNADRAGWALATIGDFVAETGVDTARDAVADMLTNLLHLARGLGLDAAILCDQAYKMMMEESTEDPEGNMASIRSRFQTLLPDDR
jgi:hypothetical protein